MSIRNHTLHQSMHYYNAALGEATSESYQDLESRKRSDDLVSANWANTINVGVNLETNNTIGSFDDPQEAKWRASCTKADFTNGLNSDPSATFGPTSHPLQSCQTYAHVSAVSSIKTESMIRRREQNKQAQRAYRQRRTQQTSNLESRVEKLAEDIKLLQCENRDLLRRLCDLRANNNILRVCGIESKTSKDSSLCGASARPTAASPTKSRSENYGPLSKEEMESLYEPYLAVWNLLSSHLPPGSQLEDFAAVLAHLQAVAIRTMQKCDRGETDEQR